MDGFRTYFRFDKKRKFGVILLVNARDGLTESFGDQLLKLVQNKYLAEELLIIKRTGKRLMEAFNNHEVYDFVTLFHKEFLAKVPPNELKPFMGKLIADHGHVISFEQAYLMSNYFGGGLLKFEDGSLFEVKFLVTKSSKVRIKNWKIRPL